MTRIDINADLGESFGRWSLGDDAALMPFLTSANIACGFHGSDPLVMRRTVQLAIRHGVAIGAHVGLPDLMGFGRRRIEITPQELRDYVIYQAGALQAFAAAEGARVEHVKPHGALYVMCAQEEIYADAMAQAVNELRFNPILLLCGSKANAAARKWGVQFVHEGYVDLDYDADGTIILERHKESMDPQTAATRAFILATEGRVPIRGGGWLPLAAQSICLHGDAENAPAVAEAVTGRLAEFQIQMAPLRDLAKLA
jgi:UPF0271 protein